jgi:hypothetical protein
LLITYSFSEDTNTGADVPAHWLWALLVPLIGIPLGRPKRRGLLLFGLLLFGLLLFTACQGDTTPAVPGGGSGSGESVNGSTYRAVLFGAVAETNCEAVEANFPEGEIAGGLVAVDL